MEEEIKTKEKKLIKDKLTERQAEVIKLDIDNTRQWIEGELADLDKIKAISIELVSKLKMAVGTAT